MTNIYIVIFVCVIILLPSCDKKSEQLEQALDLAMKNRAELEKVLHHYSFDSADSLKYRAACFLIENMPGHHSYADTAFVNNQYYSLLDSLLVMSKDSSFMFRDSVFKNIAENFNHPPSKVIMDIDYITSDYIIHNIELAFKVWTEDAWGSHLSFEDFCEYILPYKVAENQDLDSWRDDLYPLFNEDISHLNHSSLHKSNSNIACELVNERLRLKVYPRIHAEEYFPVRRISTLLNIPNGTCEDYSIMALAVMRSKGIPCAIDFTPQWPFRSMGHSWNVLLDSNTGKNLIFEGANTAPGTPHKKDHKMAKVFRKTYAINQEIKRIRQSEQSLPSIFNPPFFKDVTDEYMISEDIILTINPNSDFNYAYLTVFDNSNWIPVYWGKRNKTKVTFERMGRGIVYLPISYFKGRQTSISNPIVLDQRGDLNILNPDTINKQSLILVRKYPLFPYSYSENTRILGAKIQVANHKDFKDSVTIHTYSDLQYELKIDSLDKPYKYWRYYSSHYGYSNIAELAFYEKDSTISTKGKIIGTNGSYREDGLHTKNAAFDGDLLTFFDAPTPSDSWVGLEFETPKNIERITTIMRGDGNNIEIGNEYELFYWSQGCWNSLGKQKANYISLTFENCPTNALFVLKNQTKGEEERIFTYENGEQKWW